MLWLDTQVVLFHRDGHQLQWRWDPQATPPASVEMEILRAEGPDGPFDVVDVVDPTATFSYLDKTSPQRLQNQEIYYRLRCVDKNTGTEVARSAAFGTQGELSLDALEIIRQQRVVLEGVNGHRPIKGIPGLVTIYRKRNFGRRCPDCTDAITGQVVVSNCRACHGSGKLDGYYDPMDTGMNIMPYANALKLLNLQKTEDSDTVGQMNNFPVMYPGDIVVEPSEKHWRVTRVETRERYRVIVRQILYLTQLKPDDIAHETLRHSSHGGKRF